MLDLLFPLRCMLCEQSGTGLCPPCAGQLSAPVASSTPEGLDGICAICSYQGAGRELVLALKRGNRRDGLAVLGASLAEAIHLRGVEPAGVTWAPTTAGRRRRRGYDQSQLLARALAASLGMRAQRRLTRSGGAQMGLDSAHRRLNPVFAPTTTLIASSRPTVGAVARSGAPVNPTRTWVLVDDVVTTGATISTAAEALRSSGATSVIGAVIAVTP